MVRIDEKEDISQTEGRIYFYQRMDQRSWECDRALRRAKEACTCTIIWAFKKVQTGGNPTLSLYMSSVSIMQNNS